MSIHSLWLCGPYPACMLCTQEAFSAKDRPESTRRAKANFVVATTSPYRIDIVTVSVEPEPFDRMMGSALSDMTRNTDSLTCLKLTMGFDTWHVLLA